MRLEDLIISGTERVFFFYLAADFIISDAGTHQCTNRDFQNKSPLGKHTPQRERLTKHPVMD